VNFYDLKTRKLITDCDVDTGVSRKNIPMNKFGIYEHLRAGAERFFFELDALIENARRKNMYI
jgi:hypothetical protein